MYIHRHLNMFSNMVTEFVGPICESTDKFSTLKGFQKLEEKDLIAICDVGAYGMSLSSNYNMRPKPLEILICSFTSFNFAAGMPIARLAVFPVPIPIITLPGAITLRVAKLFAVTGAIRDLGLVTLVPNLILFVLAMNAITFV